MNIFIFLTEKNQRYWWYFFDYKKDNWEKDFKFVTDLGVTFQMLFNSIINSKYQKKWTTKKRRCSILKEVDMLNSIYSMIEELSLAYKQVVMSKEF